MEAGVLVYCPGDVEMHDIDPYAGVYEPGEHGTSSAEPLFATWKPGCALTHSVDPLEDENLPALQAVCSILPGVPTIYPGSAKRQESDALSG
tara:strand:+ start:325 stop:600 length:276 start_codon:yes stop_codon:yes gene_type:complete